MGEAGLLRIDWRTAEVSDGRLRVRLAGERRKRHARELARVIAMLDPRNEGWGEIAVGKKDIEVSSVREGSEADLRHVLDSALLEVNSEAARERSASKQEPGESEEDRRIAERFRAFAPQE
jgi:hypothetical protein